MVGAVGSIGWCRRSTFHDEKEMIHIEKLRISPKNKSVLPMLNHICFINEVLFKKE